MSFAGSEHSASRSTIALSEKSRQFLRQSGLGMDDIRILRHLYAQPAREWSAMEVAYLAHLDPFLVANRFIELSKREYVRRTTSTDQFVKYQYGGNIQVSQLLEELE